MSGATVGPTPTDGPGSGSAGAGSTAAASLSTEASPPAGAPGQAAASAATAVRPAEPSSPVLFPQADGQLTAQRSDAGTVPLNPADGQTRDGKPYRPLVFTASDVWLLPADGTTAFDLVVDAGGTVGSATQVRVNFDLTGDGSWDRVETYDYFATDPEPGPEHYTEQNGLFAGQGTLGEFQGGLIRLEVWSALGDATTLDLSQSSLTVPVS
ncbi:MAG TPA: hypothetical protein VIJ00_04805 [Nakamurella sp.]